MKLLVLGGTGRTGRHVIDAALSRGDDVRALVRMADTVPSNRGVETIVGDPLRAQDVLRAVEGVDAVVSTLGHSTKPPTQVLAGAARNVVDALRDRPDVPFLAVSQALLFPSRNPLVALLRFLLRSTVADSTAMEAAMLSSHAAFVIVRPPRLKDGGVARGYRAAVGARPAGPASMERVDLAAFLVDEAAARRFAHEVVGITAGASTHQEI